MEAGEPPALCPRVQSPGFPEPRPSLDEKGAHCGLRGEPGRDPIHQGSPEGTSRSCGLSPSFNKNSGEPPASFVGSPARTLAHPLGQRTISVYSPRGPSLRREPEDPAVNQPRCQPPQATFIHPCARHRAKSAQDRPESQGYPSNRVPKTCCWRGQRAQGRHPPWKAPFPQTLGLGRPGDAHCPRSAPGHLLF